MRVLLLALGALAFGSGAVLAQEIYIEEDRSPAGESVDIYAGDDADVVSPNVDGPRVYGWTALRPANCGTFKYWNGDYCADAREEPARPPR